MSASCCDTKELFLSGNGQSIREYLLKSACKYCTNYITDMVIWLERAIRVLYTDGKQFTDCGFRDNGIAWEDETFTDVFKKYRLELIDGTLTLYDITNYIMSDSIKICIANLRKIIEGSEEISEYDKMRLFSNIEYLEKCSE